MINVTKHALQRYATRFKGVENKNVSSVLSDNRELYEGELNKMFENAKEIYCGKFNNNNESRFYLVDNIIIVVDMAISKIITLYRVEFGFEREIDKTILESLLSHLELADESYIKAIDEVKDKKEEISYQVLSLEMEIESIEQTLDAMRTGLKALEESKKAIEVEEVRARTERDKIAKKICYSIDYRKSMEEIIED